MVTIPAHILSKLICIKCGGYLSSKPVMVNKVNQQVCGKCFNKLTIHEQKTYFKQVAYEWLAEFLVFPCRYHTDGCKYTYNWHGDADEHELTCSFHIYSLPIDYNNRHDEQQETEYNSDNFYQTPLLSKEPDGRSKLLNNAQTNSFDNVAECRKTKKAVELDFDNSCGGSNYGIFTSIDPILEKCSNCNRIIDSTNSFHCLYGHFTCQVCKGDLCQKCDAIVLKDKGFRCSYLSSGCRALLLFDDLKKHEINCEYKEFKCPVVECKEFAMLKNIPSHILQVHNNGNLVTGTEITADFSEKDRHFYFLINNKLFHAKYYFYDCEIEFLVDFVGFHDHAQKYHYRVEFLAGDVAKKYKTKSGPCLGFNENSLAKGICYDVPYDAVLRFTAKISILFSHK